MRTTIIFFLLVFTLPLNSQTKTLQLTLPEVIALAQSESPDVLLATTKLTNSYWQYQSFLANYKPRIELDATLPNINRSINAITLPNGQEAFVNRAFMNTNFDIRLRQPITSTGGFIFASTGLERIDIFKTSNNTPSKSYLSAPISVGFFQPLFAHNSLKWNKRIQPIAYSESTSEYAEEMESVAYEAAELFFEVLIAQLNLAAAKRDKNNADTLFSISQGRYSVGKIAETEVLQIELRALNADAAVAQANLQLQTNMEALRNHLGIREAVFFQLEPPTSIPDFLIDAPTALQYAKLNRSLSKTFEKQLIEAERDVDRANKDRYQISVNGNFGLTQTGVNLGDSYNNLLDQERFSLGINMPIADWGKTKAEKEIANSNLELTKMTVTQERVNFERSVLIRVQQFDLLRTQVALSKKAYDASIKRQAITRKRYLIGKISITDLNIAVSEEEDARTAYIRSVRDFWMAYFDIRSLALYDFENGVSLVKIPEGYEE